jgi:hypothetical protein
MDAVENDDAPNPANPLSANNRWRPFHQVMSVSSSYERMQIQSLLQSDAIAPERGVGLYLMPDTPMAWRTFELAVIPSLEKNGIEARGAGVCVRFIVEPHRRRTMDPSI